MLQEEELNLRDLLDTTFCKYLCTFYTSMSDIAYHFVFDYSTFMESSAKAKINVSEVSVILGCVEVSPTCTRKSLCLCMCVFMCEVISPRVHHVCASKFVCTCTCTCID